MAELIPCTHMFSNATEYMWFIEQNCDQCTRFRNGYCRTYRMTEKARWDEKYFPYNDLLDYKSSSGKVCKRFTDEKPSRKRNAKQVDGQIDLFSEDRKQETLFDDLKEGLQQSIEIAKERKTNEDT